MAIMKESVHGETEQDGGFFSLSPCSLCRRPEVEINPAHV